MSDTEAAPPSRRRSTQRQRHRRLVRKRILTGIAIAVAVVFVALWFSDTIRIPTDRPSFAGGAEPLKSNRASSDPGSPVGPTKRALSSFDPLRLWIGGDSLAGALGPALGDMTGGTGVVQPTYDSRQGTGLISGDIDWIEHASQSMVRYNPEAIVLIIGTNDAVVYTDKDEARYEQLTEQMMRVLKSDGREVLWINAPVMRDEDLEENIKKIDAIQRAAADKVGGITIVDAHTLFADEAGDYVSSLPDENGDTVSMRAGDGIHLSGAGAQHLANAVYAQLDAVWNISSQQVADDAKKVIVAPGSDRNDGNGSSGSGSGSSSGSGNGSSSRNWSSNGSGNDETSSGTTATTAPPVTAPPPPSTSSPVTTPPSSTPTTSSST